MLKSLARTALTLALGVAGGAAFFRLGTPLPWLLGAFFVTLVLTISVGGLDVDQRLRRPVMPVMGVLIGSSFNPSILDQIGSWPAGIFAAGLFTVLSSAIGYIYYSRVARWDQPTALFSAPPGGLAEMVAVGGEMGGDERRIILTHSIRIALVVVLSTLAIRFYFGTDVASPSDRPIGPMSISAEEWFILGACAVIGSLLGTRLKLPGGPIFGALILSALAHVTGLSHVSPPAWLVAGAQVILGCLLGVRFRGITRKEAVAIVSHATIGGLFLLVLALIGALILAPILDFDPRALFLAFAPGGFSEMLLVALAIGIEPAFIATCHAVRLIVIFVGVPLVGMLVARHAIVPPGDAGGAGPGVGGPGGGGAGVGGPGG